MSQKTTKFDHANDKFYRLTRTTKKGTWPTRPTPWIQGLYAKLLYARLLYARLLYARLLNARLLIAKFFKMYWKRTCLKKFHFDRKLTITYWFVRPLTLLTRGQQRNESCFFKVNTDKFKIKWKYCPLRMYKISIKSIFHKLDSCKNNEYKSCNSNTYLPT